MSLNDPKVKNAKPKEKQYKLSDSDGMYLLVTPEGGKYWRLKYRFGGKEKTLALGAYPDVSLADAREDKDDARKLLKAGVDPGEKLSKKARKAAIIAEAANSFEMIAREWFQKFSPTWAPGHAQTIISRLERDVFPCIGKQVLREITPPELLTVLRRVESRGALETAHRIKQICGQVFRYGIATGRGERDPSGDLKGALPQPETKHFAAITNPAEIGALLRAIDGYQGTFTVKCALRLAPLVFVRPGELRKAEWAEMDFAEAQWNIPGERMKMKEPHIVPLSIQAVEILRELYPLTGSGKYVFPSLRTAARPMSENTVNAAFRRMGFEKTEMSGHGLRAMARTLLDEVHGVRVDFIEHQLAHAVRDFNRQAYNRTKYLPQRREMMQLWADYLDGLKNGAAKVIPIRSAS
ncbi:MAG TPA: integrase arm-type DNA-binding domain-containing protein [Syntrophobacteraceae bacterium]|nr:integrase arm-type DNA-binding domain-containing protein [Syntrophobacteraceae bacterium]